MITKIYIDNFRCFTNFELELDSFNLLLGANGTGKSTLFDVLSRMRDLLAGARVGQCFSSTDLTAWDTRKTHDFAIDLSAEDDEFNYRLRIEHDPESRTRRIAKEGLSWNSQTIYNFENGEVQLYGVAGSSTVREAKFPFDATQSFIPLLPEGQGIQPVCRFRRAVYQWLHVRLVPAHIVASSKEESSIIDPEGANFSSWYRHLTQAQPEVIAEVTGALQEVIPGFQHLRFAPGGEAKWLEVVLEKARSPLAFFQLSDGQRALIVLYTLLHSVPSLGYKLFIDEPDNYVCLREIQPWLLKLEDLCSEAGRQAVLISHHPEIINPLAKEHGIWFSRPDNGPVRASRDYPVVDGLTAAETMARGWDDE